MKFTYPSKIGPFEIIEYTQSRNRARYCIAVCPMCNREFEQKVQLLKIRKSCGCKLSRPGGVPRRSPLHFSYRFLTQEDINKFWSRAITNENGCQLYNNPSVNTYQFYYWQGIRIRAHRVAYSLFNKTDISDSERVIDHLCNKRACVNPTHLQLVSLEDNSRRGKGNKAKLYSRNKTSKSDLFRYGSIEIKLLSNIHIDLKTNCWQYQHVNGAGYGYITWRGVGFMAHRVAYTTIIGDIPNGYVIDHKCESKNCCNPAHLQVVTLQENIRRSNTKRAKV